MDLMKNPALCGLMVGTLTVGTMFLESKWTHKDKDKSSQTNVFLVVVIATALVVHLATGGSIKKLFGNVLQSGGGDSGAGVGMPESYGFNTGRPDF